VPSRERAQAEIESGRVLVQGAPASKAARLVDAGEAIRLVGPPARFVSRGGEKLDAALERFEIDVAGRRVLDAGASTGGFTDCVLQRGAAAVIALDVGYGQLHERLVDDPRVTNLERTNLRHTDIDVFGGACDLVVADLSFISLRTVADQLLAACRPGGELVVLVKPQFEAGRQEASKGRGIITDPVVWRRVLTEAIAAFTDRGAIIMGAMASPLRGSDGNVEFLVHAARPDAALDSAGRSGSTVAVDIDAVVDEATASAEQAGGR
jgi:23S rRNA (cytidine1920-2'-O)/16S rRNA (cytidine1409-2'-O)-methyltransferase